VGLLRDQWGLVRNGTRPPGPLMRILAASVQGRPHYAVADTAVGIAREVERLLETLADAPALEAYRAWIEDVFRPAFHETGAEAVQGESPADGLRRASLYRALAGIARNEDALAHATRLADRERADAASVDANLAGMVVALSAFLADGKRFDLHKQTYEKRRAAQASPQETDRYLGSFAALRAAGLVQRTLDLLDDATVPKQSVGPVLAGLLREPHAQALAWAYLRKNWTKLRRELGDSWAANLAEAAGFMPPAMRDEVESFLADNAQDLVQSSKRAKASLAERQALFATVVPTLAAWAVQAETSPQ
jgi:hypothetical protein